MSNPDMELIWVSSLWNSEHSCQEGIYWWKHSMTICLFKFEIWKKKYYFLTLNELSNIRHNSDHALLKFFFEWSCFLKWKIVGVIYSCKNCSSPLYFNRHTFHKMKNQYCPFFSLLFSQCLFEKSHFYTFFPGLWICFFGDSYSCKIIISETVC